MTTRAERIPEAIAQTLDRSQHSARVGLAPPTHTVHGPASRVWDTIAELRAQVRHEILGIDDTTYLQAAGVPDSIQQRGAATLRKALRRGVEVRQVTSAAGLLADHELGAIVYRAGGRARVVRRVPAKVSILDRRLALVPVDSTVLAEGFRLVRDPSVVAALVAVHRGLWESGTDPDLDSHDDGPPAHLAAVLPALTSGDPDDVAARRLGISPRTFSRRVTALMELVGAPNRFQAGVEVARRGWL